MFDIKKYRKEYMRKYRKTHKEKPEAKEKRNKYAKYYLRNVLRNNPEWVEKERLRGREYSRKRRKDPEFRKLAYKKHIEWAKKNKEHLKAYVKKRREENPAIRLKAKVYYLKRYYGLTHEKYIDKRKSQDDKCTICKKTLGIGSVDHNHKTKQIRDILCRFCNLRLGFVENNRHLVIPMVEYLDKWERRLHRSNYGL